MSTASERPLPSFMTFDPKRLRHAREAAGLSVGQAGRKLGILPFRIRLIESGHERPSMIEVDRFAACYDVLVQWLLRMQPYDL